MPENATNGHEWRNKALCYSELLTTHAKNPVTEKDCSVPPRFAYRYRTLHQLILKPKKIKDDEEYIFSNLLPQTSGSEERRDSSRHGTHHGGRQPDAVQLQADRRSETVGHQRGTCHGQKHGGTRSEPYA